MRRLAQTIAALMSLAMMMTELPWALADCPPDTCSMSLDAAWWSVVLMALLPLVFVGVIVIVVLVGVLGIRDSGRASDGAVYAALGQSQAHATRSAALRGLRDGGVAMGIVFAVTGVVHVMLVLQAGYGWGGLGVSSGLWLSRAVTAIAFIGMLVLAHVVDSVRPRRTPVERLHDDAAAPRARRIPLRARALLLGTAIALAAGILTGLAVTHDNADGDAGTVSKLAAQWAELVIGFGAVALFFAVGVPLIRQAVAPALGLVARAADALRAPQVAAVLRARATTSSGTSARTVLAIAGLALLAGSLASANPAPGFAPSYVGTLTLHPAGVGEDVAEQIAGIEGVQTVVVGTLSGGDGTSPMEVVGVDPADLAGVDDELAALLNEHPGAMVTAGWFSDLSLDNLASQGIDVTGLLLTSTSSPAIVDSNEVPLPTAGAAVLVWGEPGADLAAVGAAVMNFTPEGDAVEGWGGSTAHYEGSSDPVGMLYVVGLIVLVCIGPVVALAYGVVSGRRRDDATLAALGASRRALGIAAVVETAVIAAVVVSVGLLSGAIVHATLAATGRARDSLLGVITDSYAQVMAHSVAWAALPWMLAISVAAFALVAWIVKAATREALPVEELRAAESGVVR